MTELLYGIVEKTKKETMEEAKKEAERCMRCYRLFGVVTQLPIPGFNQKAQ